MKAIIKIQQRNPKFDLDYANEYHGGQESEGNQRILWYWEYKYPITDFKLKKNHSTSIDAYPLTNLSALDCFRKKDTTIGFLVSNDIIETILTTRNEKKQTITIVFELRPTQDFQKLPDKKIFLSTAQFKAYSAHKEKP